MGSELQIISRSRSFSVCEGEMKYTAHCEKK